LWLACYTQEEIAEVVGLDKANVSRKLEEYCDLAKVPDCNILEAKHSDLDPLPIYNVWKLKENSNKSIKHFGNTALLQIVRSLCQWILL